MFIKNIKITNFKSLYGTHEFDFEDLKGLIKLSGSIGSGKTSLGEAILFGLYGNVKGQDLSGLASWGTKGSTEIDLNMTCRNKDISIHRVVGKALEVTIDGKLLVASNKKDTQSILENEYYDVPRLVIERMCIISFNQFKSVANMNPADTKMFLDEVFGFNTFTEFNNVIVDERKTKNLELTRAQSLYDEACSSVDYFVKQQNLKQQELDNQIDIDSIYKKIEEHNTVIQEITDIMNERKVKKEAEQKVWKDKIEINNDKIRELKEKISEYTILGRQEKEWYQKFQSGVCPTCGQSISTEEISKHKNSMTMYAELIRSKQDIITDIEKVSSEYKSKIDDIERDFSDFRQGKIDVYNEHKAAINNLKNEITKYNTSKETIKNNYEQMIVDYENKRDMYKKQLDTFSVEIGEWNEMNELFTKTLRYNLLNSLVPQINRSISLFINKFELIYNVEFDQEFKSHIYAFGVNEEIKYANLSTGQKKTLDIAIILGILQNVISMIDFNILFCDELFSNMDINSRNIMLQVLNESNVHNRTIFVINHAEMPDDSFRHKIKVTLSQKKITDKKKNELCIRASKYEKIF